MNLVKRQAKLLDCIERSLQVYGYPPTIREMGRAADITSESMVKYHLDKLEAWGYIERDDGARAIRLLRGSDGVAREMRIVTVGE